MSGYLLSASTCQRQESENERKLEDELLEKKAKKKRQVHSNDFVRYCQTNPLNYPIDLQTSQDNYYHLRRVFEFVRERE